MLIKWNSFSDLEKELKDSFKWNDRSIFQTGWSPTVDVSDDDNQYMLEAEMPGMDEEDIEISLEDKLLVISGEKLIKKENEGKRFSRIERSSGSFSRSFTLPTAVEANEISASFNKGILTITIPKVPRKVPKKIKINFEKI